MAGKKKKWIKWALIGGAAAAAAGVLRFRGAGQRNAAAGMTAETAEIRDIKTFRSFTGTIAPVTSREILPDVIGVKIDKVLVEDGDEVKAGDELVLLNPDSLKQQVAELSATINAAEASSSLNIDSAVKTYNDYKYNLDNGLDTSIQSAKSAMDSAHAQLVSAQEAYNNEVLLNNQQLSSTIMSAQQQVDNAYRSVESAKLSLEQVSQNLQRAYDYEAEHAGEPGISSGYLSSSQQLEQSKASAQLQLEAALVSYNNAVDAYEAAKQNEENNLTRLYETLISAQEAYFNAVTSYNAAVRNSQQTLGRYALQVETAKAGANQETNKLRLADLESQADNYVVTAPVDGVITSLNAREGSVTAAAQPLAVVTDFDEMKIDIRINEYDILGVREGKDVTVTIDALNKNYEGRIEKISRMATIMNGVSYFEAEVNFDADEDARSGMSAEVRMMTNNVSDAVTISSEAVQNADDGSSYVNLYDQEGNMIQWPVTLGASDGTYTEIVNGLGEGETVYYTPSGSPFDRMR